MAINEEGQDKQHHDDGDLEGQDKQDGEREEDSIYNPSGNDEDKMDVDEPPPDKPKKSRKGKEKAVGKNIISCLVVG